MKRRVWLLALWLLTPALARAAVTFDAAACARNDATTVTSVTISGFTVANQTNRVLLGSGNINCAGSCAAITATYNALAMTSQEEVTDGTSSRLGTFFRIAPTVGANDYIVSLDAAKNLAVAVISLYDVDQTTHAGTDASVYNTSGGSASVNVTVPANGLGVSFGASRNSNFTLTVGAGETERGTAAGCPAVSGSATAGANVWASVATTASTGVQALDWTISDSGPDIGVVGIPLNATAGVLQRLSPGFHLLR
jgi:hypothetical protein